MLFQVITQVGLQSQLECVSDQVLLSLLYDSM